MSEQSASCRCQNCNQNIEFDASQFATDETRTVECPHCHLETTLFVRQRAFPPKEPALMPQEPIEQAPVAKQTGTSLLDTGSAIMFLLGCGMVLIGCVNDLGESTREQGSAI